MNTLFKEEDGEVTVQIPYAKESIEKGIKKDTGNWLLSFSDLLFILVAFFIWRQQYLTDEMIPETNFVVETFEEIEFEDISEKIIEFDAGSILTPSKTANTLNHELEVSPAWFSSDGEMTMQGASRLKSLLGVLEGLDIRLQLRLMLGTRDGELANDDFDLENVKLIQDVRAYLKQKVDYPVDLEIVSMPTTSRSRVKLSIHFL